jgi:hypothetical protein
MDEKVSEWEVRSIWVLKVAFAGELVALMEWLELPV